MNTSTQTPIVQPHIHLPGDPRHWLKTQQQQGRELVLIINRMQGRDPLPALFEKAPLREYRSLYQGGEFDDLASRGPWLAKLDHSWTEAIDHLLSNAAQHWGWIASAAQLDLAQIVEHWTERQLIVQNGQRFFYRFQDNRVIARHLTALAPAQVPLLLGPLQSALCWNGEHWLHCDNPKPALHPAPFAMPWADVPEPADIAHDIRRTQLRRWIFENHAAAAKQLRKTQDMDSWLVQQMTRSVQWNWLKDEQVLFLLEHQLDPRKSSCPEWQPKSNETSQAHYWRCKREWALKTK